MGVAMSGAASDSYVGGLFRTASAGNLARRFKARQRTARGQVYRPAGNRQPKLRKKPASPKRDQVAELLSLDLDFDAIAERIGISRKAVKRHFECICKALGTQAI
jgi:DNA-binding NarL/FixJ family response regulator